MNRAELISSIEADKKRNNPSELPENHLQQVDEKIDAVNDRLARLRENIHSTKNKEAAENSKKLMKELEDELRRLLARKKNFGV